jgi:hypothetical protein
MGFRDYMAGLLALLGLASLYSPWRYSTLLNEQAPDEQSRVRALPFPNAHDVKVVPMKKTCLNSTGPTPVILFTLGRSGSQSTWQVMTNLTGLETEPHEYTGSAPQGAERFLANKMTSNDWIVNHMCYKQKKYAEEPNGIVGFNWKPFQMFFDGGDSAPAIPGLKRIAELAQSQMPIRVIRSRRNLLDVYRSKTKHIEWEKENSRLPPHCYSGSVQCVALHAQASRSLALNATTLYSKLYEMTRKEDYLDELFARLQVPTVHVSYDKLYYPETPIEGSSEWNQIFQFVGKRSNWTWEEITEVMDLVPSTKTRSHRDSIQNFDEVQAVLNGTEFSKLLRP